MIAKDVKDYFYRHFLGLVKVNSMFPAMGAPEVSSLKRDAEVHSRNVSQELSVQVSQAQMQAKIKINGADLLALREISCLSVGFRFAAETPRVREAQIKKYAPLSVPRRKFSAMKIEARSGLKQMMVLPQERMNRLQWQTARPPRKDGEVVLACFCPVVENAVAKLSLNKRRGTLLIWYNPQSRHFDVKGLYLCRRMGLNENLEWRWH